MLVRMDFSQDYAEACEMVHVSLLNSLRECARKVDHQMNEREMAEWMASHHSQAIIAAFGLGALWRDQWPDSDIRLGVEA
jgi:hypothetical protein